MLVCSDLNLAYVQFLCILQEAKLFCLLLVARYFLLVARYFLLVARYFLLVACYFLLAVRYILLLLVTFSSKLMWNKITVNRKKMVYYNETPPQIFSL